MKPSLSSIKLVIKRRMGSSKGESSKKLKDVWSGFPSFVLAQCLRVLDVDQVETGDKPMVARRAAEAWVTTKPKLKAVKEYRASIDFESEIMEASVVAYIYMASKIARCIYTRWCLSWT